MKLNMLILLGVLLALAAGCPQTEKGDPATGSTADPNAALQNPPAMADDNNASAADPAAQPPAAAGAASATGAVLELDGMQLGMALSEVKAKVPASWTPSEQWAPQAKDLSGIINYVGPMEPPKKGVVIPPEIASYAFFEGKLIGMSHTMPGSRAEAFDAWVAQSAAKFGPAGTVLPDFALACDFLVVMRSCPPTDKLVAWDNANTKCVLAAQFAPASGMASYYLADTSSYAKLIEAMMAKPAGAPAAAPGAGA